ncbi:MAG: hypothetical protein KDK30_14730, partial [Leptospiraceae bacterium]|nr:hypothetical protein [Leptospiraceae bacterium]
RLYESAPESIRTDKTFVLLVAQSASRVDDDQYLEYMEHFRKLFPEDPALYMIDIDYYFIKREFKKLEEIINNLYEIIGGDPYLKLLLGEIYAQDNRPEDGLVVVNEAITAEPDLYSGYAVKLDILLTLQRYDDAVDVLRALETMYGADTVRELMGMLEADGSTVEFTRSEAFQEYRSQLESPE